MLEFLFVDLFAGAGGVTTGIERARVDGQKIARVIAAVNHDPLAIESHAANHPETIHYVEDIRTFNVHNLPYIPPRGSRGNTIVCLWASLECTNFSQAKGGQSRDADSRTLAEHLDRYVEHIDPDYIYIENVKEFLTWGPLIQKRDKTTGELMFDKNDKPIMIPDPERKGEDFDKWKAHIESYGYRSEWRILNAADYGAYTMRRRLFGIFAKPNYPIVFPKPTHSRKEWKPVKHKIQLSNHGESIFARKKPLCEKTLQRLGYGIDKFVLKGQGQFLMSYYGTGKNVHSLDEPCHTITTKDRFALITADKPQFITQHIQNRPSANSSLDEPLGAILTKESRWLVTVEPGEVESGNQFLLQYYGRDNAVSDINEPCRTIPTQNKMALVTVDKGQFLEHRYSSKYNVSSVDNPLPAVTTNPKASLVTVLMDSGIIKDIKMRLLTVEELKEITGFGKEYVLKGNSADQKKFIGNAVPPDMAQVLIEATYKGLEDVLYGYYYEMQLAS